MMIDQDINEMLTRIITKRLGQTAAIALLSVCAISGCGQKGPLRSPDDDNKKATAIKISPVISAVALDHAGLKV